MAQRRRKDDEPDIPEDDQTDEAQEPEVTFTPAPAMVEAVNTPAPPQSVAPPAPEPAVPPAPEPARAPGEVAPVYQVAGHCATCRLPVAVLVNAESLQGPARQSASVLTSCTCASIGFDPQRVTRLNHP
jgi:hypothetical protein